MARGSFALILQQLRHMAGARPVTQSTDADLLDRFTAQRDEPAFAELVRRHGGMVLDVCRRVLGEAHSAEDAFQATFLVLARRAATVRKRGSVGSWLFGVARRVALKARSAEARRRLHERRKLDMTSSETPDVPAADALRAQLDEALDRLPEKYRAALVLCYLQGRTNAEAAAELGCQPGTVAWRLNRGREVLRRRLARHEMALPAGGLAALLADGSAQAAPSGSLVEATAVAAARFAAGEAGAVAASVTGLAEGVLQNMFVAKMKAVLVVCLGIGVALGGGVAAYTGIANAGGQPSAAAPPAAPPLSQRIADAIRLLDSQRFEQRQAANDFLVKADLEALPALRAAPKEKHSLETTRRIEGILKTISKPERMLQVRMELPATPVMLREGGGHIGVKLWLKNTWDEPVVVCQPLDGSMDSDRDPKYGFRLFDEQGNEVKGRWQRFCGNVNTVRAVDFIRLEPGDKVDVWNHKGSFGYLSTANFPDLKPGTYTLAARYRMTGAGKPGGISGAPAPDAQALLKNSLVCDLISEPVKIRVAAAPATERLHTMVENLDDREFSLGETVAALLVQKQLPSFDALCKILCHHDVQARQAAASILSRYNHPRKAEVLVWASRDQDEHVRRVAVTDMYGIKEKKVLAALIDCLADSDLDVRYTAIQRLQEAAGQTFGYDPYLEPKQSAASIQKWRTWWRERKD